MCAFAENDWTRERWLSDTRWMALLSDGSRPFSDDGRPGQPTSSWLRLKEHVQARGLKVISLWLAFRDHEERPLPESAKGYFFRRGALCFPGQAETIQLFLLGYLQGDVVRVQTWRVPELTFEGEEIRQTGEVEDSLIKN